MIQMLKDTYTRGGRVHVCVYTVLHIIALRGRALVPPAWRHVQCLRARDRPTPSALSRSPAGGPWPFSGQNHFNHRRFTGCCIAEGDVLWCSWFDITYTLISRSNDPAGCAFLSVSVPGRCLERFDLLLYTDTAWSGGFLFHSCHNHLLHSRGCGHSTSVVSTGYQACVSKILSQLGTANGARNTASPACLMTGYTSRTPSVHLRQCCLELLPRGGEVSGQGCNLQDIRQIDKHNRKTCPCAAGHTVAFAMSSSLSLSVIALNSCLITASLSSIGTAGDSGIGESVASTSTIVASPAPEPVPTAFFFCTFFFGDLIGTGGG